jgi:D-ribose pyranase
MITTTLLNPQILSLLARVRHTNALVIADRGFPFWPAIETIDISLTDDVPTVLQVLAAVRAHFHPVEVKMAEEFLQRNDEPTRTRFAAGLAGVAVGYEPHVAFKQRIPAAIGLIRTGDRVQYANMVLISG